MGYTCRCGAVYADSDVAKFMQHVQKCSGVGERAQPTPRGGKGGAVRSATASTSRGSVGKDWGSQPSTSAGKGPQVLTSQGSGQQDPDIVRINRTSGDGSTLEDIGSAAPYQMKRGRVIKPDWYDEDENPHWNDEVDIWTELDDDEEWVEGEGKWKGKGKGKGKGKSKVSKAKNDNESSFEDSD